MLRNSRFSLLFTPLIDVSDLDFSFAFGAGWIFVLALIVVGDMS